MRELVRTRAGNWRAEVPLDQGGDYVLMAGEGTDAAARPVARGEVVLRADGPEPVAVSVYGRPYRITGRPAVLALQTRPAE